MRHRHLGTEELSTATEDYQAGAVGFTAGGYGLKSPIFLDAYVK